MSGSTSGTLTYRRLRAPRQHGATLIDPPWSDLEALVDRNIESLRDLRRDIAGQELRHLRASARRTTLAIAQRYTQNYRDAEVPADVQRLYLAGHQPELFHPGVWFKNFVLGHLASRDGAVAVNLIVDNDLAKSTAIRSPALIDGEVHAQRIALDRPGGDVPYEQRAILDAELFQSFDKRVEDALRPWISDPVVRELWPLAREAAERRPLLGLVLAEARHRLEGQWGLTTLEVPLSQLCDTAEFRWFACHLLADLPRFHRIYNEALADYRRLHRIRSRSHPVPDLEEEDGWLEAPLWMWSDERPRRQRVFVRASRDGIELTDRESVHLLWPLHPEQSAERAVEAWQADRARGIKLRPRALLTTMFARLCVGDVFLHGIGGAKYDQLTDELLRRWWNLEPPGYATISATMLLPIPHANVEAEDVRRVDQCLRELRFNPERHAPPEPEVQELARAKRTWIETELPVGERRPRHQAIVEINEKLQPWVAPLRERLERERAELVARLHDAELLRSREYSFCLFPAASLRAQLTQLAQGPDA